MRQRDEVLSSLKGVDALVWAETEAARGTDVFQGEFDALGALQTAFVRLAELPPRLRSAQQELKAAPDAAAVAKKALEEQTQSISKDARSRGPSGDRQR